MSWCTIESDPGVFSELIHSMGVKGIELNELYSIDYNQLKALEPVYGLIFLFKWQGEKDDRPQLDETPDGLFFAKQVITNACATQALLSCLLNIQQPVELGSELTTFKEFTVGLPGDLAGEAIGNSENIRIAHNSFARPEPFVFEEKKNRDNEEEEDAFHFISYVKHNNKVYELDGLKRGPILLEEMEEGKDWLEVVTAHINQRIEKYQSKEIRFNLLAMVKERKLVIEEKIKKIEEEMNELRNTNNGMGGEEELTRLSIELNEQRELLKEEERKQEEWKKENIRRRHNYVPFIFHCLKLLAEKGKLTELTQKAAIIQAERKQRKKQNKEKEKEKQNIAQSSSSATDSTTINTAPQH